MRQVNPKASLLIFGNCGQKKQVPSFKEEKKINTDIKHQVKKHLRTVYLLKDEQIDHMLTVASKTLASNLSNANSALKNRDYQLLALIAHTIKGSLLNLGLNDVAKQAKKIEINAKDKIETNLQATLSQLSENLTELLRKE